MSFVLNAITNVLQLSSFEVLTHGFRHQQANGSRRRDNAMTAEETIAQIKSQFKGIDEEDLTKMEKNILKIIARFEGEED